METITTSINTLIAIPCYNEAKRLPVASYIDFISSREDIGFLFVNDGSKDNTIEILNEIVSKSRNSHVLDLKKNGGKAEAVRQGLIYGFEHFNPKYIGFWDADLATPLNEIAHFCGLLTDYEFNMVTGLRLMRLGAKVKRSQKRHYLGRIFASFASLLLKLPVYDTQCGAKMYEAKLVPLLFKDPFISKWLFDVEILARYINNFGRNEAILRIYEHPIYEWEDIGNSNLKMKDFFVAPLELLKIKRKYFSHQKSS
jgi:glycosyltransferase involved in cell wall biosynthesis